MLPILRSDLLVQPIMVSDAGLNGVGLAVGGVGAEAINFPSACFYVIIANGKIKLC
jgi:hypothetical protein